jgi:transcriptional regulator with GAF, ATPase, and Fis domain
MKDKTQRVSEKYILDAITTVLSNYIAETDPYVLFNGLLDVLLEITGSEYGFIGEVFYTNEGSPFVKSYATTNIAWSKETNRLYEENKKKGMVFSRPNSLYGAVLTTGQLVISNQPATDPRSGGLPKGHPPLNTFMGLPFYGGGKLLGMVGVANNKNGYHKSIVECLHPFLITCGNLIQAYRNNQKHELVVEELNKYKERFSLSESEVILGSGYKFSKSPINISRHGKPVLLTKKELLLIEILVAAYNQPVSYLTIEEHVWSGVITGESSLRSLVRRLRLKLPELSIKTSPGIGYILIISD